MQAAATTVPPAAWMAAMHSRDRQARGDDVLDHDDLLARLDMEAAPQLELAALALDVHRADVQVLAVS